MTVKDLVITLFFIGSIALAILGGWNYMKGRVLLYQEQVKIDNGVVTGQYVHNAEEELNRIKKDRDNGLYLFIAGFSGFFLVISYLSRRRKRSFLYKNKNQQP